MDCGGKKYTAVLTNNGTPELKWPDDKLWKRITEEEGKEKG